MWNKGDYVQIMIAIDEDDYESVNELVVTSLETVKS